MVATQAQDVKQVLLEELGTLSYAEKRKVRDALNAKYIDAELKNLEKQKKYPIMFGLFQLTLVLQVVESFFSDQASEPGIVLFIRLVAGLLGAFMAGIMLGKLDKRRLIYRVFSRLAALNKSTDATVST